MSYEIGSGGSVPTDAEYAKLDAAAKRLQDIGRLQTRNAMLVRALQAAKGYMLNAQIDLETDAKRSTALATIKGGVRVISNALDTLED